MAHVCVHARPAHALPSLQVVERDLSSLARPNLQVMHAAVADIDTEAKVSSEGRGTIQSLQFWQCLGAALAVALLTLPLVVYERAVALQIRCMFVSPFDAMHAAMLSHSLCKCISILDIVWPALLRGVDVWMCAL